MLPGEQWSVWSGEEGGAGWGREEITLEHLLSHVTTSTIINNIFTSHQCSANKKYFRNYHRYLTLLVEGSGGVKKWRGGGQFDPPYLKALKSHSKVAKCV